MNSLFAILGYGIGSWVLGYFMGACKLPPPDPEPITIQGDIVVNTTAGADAKEIAQQIRRNIRRGVS